MRKEAGEEEKQWGPQRQTDTDWLAEWHSSCIPELPPCWPGPNLTRGLHSIFTATIPPFLQQTPTFFLGDPSPLLIRSIKPKAVPEHRPFLGQAGLLPCTLTWWFYSERELSTSGWGSPCCLNYLQVGILPQALKPIDAWPGPHYPHLLSGPPAACSIRTVLNFIWALCSWKATVVKKLPHLFKFWGNRATLLSHVPRKQPIYTSCYSHETGWWLPSFPASLKPQAPSFSLRGFSWMNLFPTATA